MRDAGRSFRALLVAVICGVPRYTVKCATRNDSAGGALWQDGLFSNALLEFTPSEPLDRCAKDLQAYRDDVSNLALWAVKMFDASSKGPVGLLSGDSYYLGHYDQCLSISVPDIRISGRYTIVKINFVPTKYPNYRPLGMIDYREPNPKSKVWVSTKPSSDPSKTRRDEFFWAICHPDSCSSDRLRLILEKRFNKIAGLNVSVNVDPTMSSTFGDEEPMTKGHYIFFTLIGLNLTLVLIGTWHDLVVSKKCETKTRFLKNVLKPFSVSSNVRHLLKKNNDSELSIINGMKVIAVCNVILGRRILVLFGNALSNPEYNEKVTKTLWYGYFNPTVIMETFFVVSGFLTYHVVVKEINRTKTFDLMIMVIYRWLRIIPVYASVIAIYVFVLPRLGDGPLWKSIILKETKSCEISWWSNIAFLNNYISTEYLCVIPSWYLACDMHFFLLGSVLTYAAWKSIRVGVTLMAGALILSIYVPSKIIYDNKYWGSQPVYVEKLRDLNNEAYYISLYIKSHNRATTYLIGLMMAVLYEKLKERKYKFSTSQLLFSMIVCIILGNAVFLSSYMLYIPGRPYDPWTNIILFSLTRIIWALTIGFIIIAHGTTGLDFFSAFLGHKIFNFLGKLTFCVYMYQEIVQLITVGTMRSPGYASNFQIIWMTCGDITATYVIAIVVHFMVESPCDRMQYKIIRFLTRGPKVNIKEDTKVDMKESTESYQPQPNNF